MHKTTSGSLVAGLSRTLSACAVAVTAFIGCADAPPAEEGTGESRLAVGEECQPGTYASDDGSCLACTSVSHCTSEISCTDASSSTCTECASGYWLDSHIRPTVCGACTDVPHCVGALSCTNAFDSVCSACFAPGYYLDANGCTACTPVSHCTDYPLSCTNASDSTCSHCAPGYYVNDGSCTPCTMPPGCGAATCTDATDSLCTGCASGYYQDSTVAPPVCEPCTSVSGCVSPVTCTTATNSQCTQCAEGTWKSGSVPSVCMPCSPIPFCTTAISCTNAGNSTCATCAPGYYLDASYQCQACTQVPFCISPVTCESASTSQCTQCGADFRLVEGEADSCVACDACPAGQYKSGGCVNGVPTCTACDAIPGCAATTCTGPGASACTACLPGYRLDGTTCTPTCAGFAADPLLWGQPLARNDQIVDTDPSAGGTLKYRYQKGSTIPVKVRALDCSSADITSKPNVSGTLHVYADLGCDGVADQELRDGRTGLPGAMKKTDGFLAYDLDTTKFPSSPACFVLEVVVRDTTTGNEAREKTLVQRK